MNKVILAGRMVRDPELKTLGTGTEVCNFTVAVDRRFKKDEEKQADFIDCTAWNKTGAFVSKYFKKGDGIVIDGRLESQKWEDKNGNKRVSWSVTCDNVEFPIGKGKGDTTVSDAPNYTDITDDEDLPF
ncbi:MAG: single-stranded DNA-binding protein [Christensenellales bacterium]